VDGSGFVTAQFLQFPSGFFELRSINYEVATMLEPGTWFLLGTRPRGAWRMATDETFVIGWVQYLRIEAT